MQLKRFPSEMEKVLKPLGSVRFSISDTSNQPA